MTASARLAGSPDGPGASAICAFETWGDVSRRRIADIADSGLGRLSWADSSHFDVRTGTANLGQKWSIGQTLETIHIRSCRGCKRVAILACEFIAYASRKQNSSQCGDLSADRRPAAAESRRDCNSLGAEHADEERGLHPDYGRSGRITSNSHSSFPAARTPKPCSANRSDARSSVSPLA
jgi:hypothetical protein